MILKYNCIIYNFLYFFFLCFIKEHIEINWFLKKKIQREITFYPLKLWFFLHLSPKLSKCIFYSFKLYPFYTYLLNYGNTHFIPLNYELFYTCPLNHEDNLGVKFAFW